MATIEEVKSAVTELTSTLEAVDLKLDEVKAFILALQAGSVVSQEQLDELAGLVLSAKEKASAALAETDALDEPATPPVEPPVE